MLVLGPPVVVIWRGRHRNKQEERVIIDLTRHSRALALAVPLAAEDSMVCLVCDSRVPE